MKGVDFCPEGYQPISDPEECSTAAGILGLTYDSAESGQGSDAVCNLSAETPRTVQVRGVRGVASLVWEYRPDPAARDANGSSLQYYSGRNGAIQQLPNCRGKCWRTELADSLRWMVCRVLAPELGKNRKEIRNLFFD